MGKLAKDREQGREQVVRQYFEFWNERRMEEATSLFSSDATYEDTLYPERFDGQEGIKFHLLRVAEALPKSFCLGAASLFHCKFDERILFCS